MPHLVGLGDCVKDGCSDGENTAKDENYVLQKLLKKTGKITDCYLTKLKHNNDESMFV